MFVFGGKDLQHRITSFLAVVKGDWAYTLHELSKMQMQTGLHKFDC